MHALDATVAELISPGKDLLAADESIGTLEKRFRNFKIVYTEEARRQYRELLFTTPGIGESINGVILFEEILRQCTDAGIRFPNILSKQGMVPGIKMDNVTVRLPGYFNEQVTQGLDNLAERITEYHHLGARFANWRAVFFIGDGISTPQGIATNAEVLARYASICQNQWLVPIVEPEVLMDGGHGIDICAQATEKVLHTVFHALHQ